MDWGERLRAFRRRTGMKQEVVAGHLMVSQAYISRLEAGRAKPSQQMRDRIVALLSTPEHRPHFEHCCATVRYCPGFVALLKASDSEIQIVEISQGFRQLGAPFAYYQPGDVVGPEIGTSDRALERLREVGLFSGEVDCVRTTWRSDGRDGSAYWLGTNVPIRDDSGEWYVHNHNVPMSKSEHDAWIAEHGDTILIVSPANDERPFEEGLGATSRI
ncbi:hypothetical protein DDZ18_11725 [Marinicauda salina]|uniref:HTH cro/C1-type domain-containing protein n=1 Tax=Marinicauda salina TaxID=2135793 RepID=A0A2U2BS86_9PROT|nr:helix-turn-helix transcriptional regulator [Marinicauda salina]PWE16852.1 hypothetical protein DDZ18_11725 [Marinicauda salina]